ncbi:MAG: GNVR domain-containing protein [Pseudomonadota bacterium]
MKDPNALYITMMKSRAVTEKIVQRFDLQKAYGTKTLTDTLNVLESVSRIGAGKDGVLAIEVDDRVPERAAALANAYVDELNKFMQTLALTEAAQRRKFFETQLKSAKDRLTDAELLLDRTPNTSLQYMDARRNLKFEESVYEVLVKQFEIAKLDESKDSPLIQVLDKAITPEKKSKPKRTVIVALSMTFAFLVSVLWLFFREKFVKSGRLHELRMRLGIEK